jgi:hypothetical protein
MTQRGENVVGEGAGDRFGWSVSMSSDGNTLAVGAYKHVGTASAYYAGHTRVFDWDTDALVWAKRGGDIDGEAGGFQNSKGWIVGDNSGWSVSMSSDGNTVAIGAPLNDAVGSGSVGVDGGGGHTRVFDWDMDALVWVKRGDDIDSEAVGDKSGYSVSMSSNGNSLAIGAPYNSGNGSTKCGHTRVFDWDTGALVWGKRGDDIDGEAAGDESGFSVSMSSDGSTLAIGAHKNTCGGGSNCGHTRVFDWDTDALVWAKRGDDIDGEAAGDQSGFSVSMSSDGNTVGIGNANGGGHTRVFDWDTDASVWAKRGDISDDEEAFVRGSVSMSSEGHTLAIGTIRSLGGFELFGGHTRVFDWDTDESVWVQRWNNTDGTSGSGFSVAMSSDGHTLAVGAPFYGAEPSIEAGHTRVFDTAVPLGIIVVASPNSLLCNGGTTTVTVTASGGTGSYDGVGVFTGVSAGSHT